MLVSYFKVEERMGLMHSRSLQLTTREPSSFFSCLFPSLYLFSYSFVHFKNMNQFTKLSKPKSWSHLNSCFFLHLLLISPLSPLACFVLLSLSLYCYCKIGIAVFAIVAVVAESLLTSWSVWEYLERCLLQNHTLFEPH